MRLLRGADSQPRQAPRASLPEHQQRSEVVLPRLASGAWASALETAWQASRDLLIWPCLVPCRCISHDLVPPTTNGQLGGVACALMNKTLESFLPVTPRAHGHRCPTELLGRRHTQRRPHQAMVARAQSHLPPVFPRTVPVF